MDETQDTHGQIDEIKVQSNKIQRIEDRSDTLNLIINDRLAKHDALLDLINDRIQNLLDAVSKIAASQLTLVEKISSNGIIGRLIKLETDQANLICNIKDCQEASKSKWRFLWRSIIGLLCGLAVVTLAWWLKSLIVPGD